MRSITDFLVDAGTTTCAMHSLCSNVTLLTAHSDYANELASIAVASHASYAARHGYETAVRTEPAFHNRGGGIQNMGMSKFVWVRQLFAAGVPCVLWMDADAIITNPLLSVAAMLQKATVAHAGRRRASLFFAGDTMIINSGVMLWRNTPWARSTLETLVEIFPQGFGIGADNGALAILLGGCTAPSAEERRAGESAQAGRACLAGPCTKAGSPPFVPRPSPMWAGCHCERREEWRRCYKRADQGYTNATLQRLIVTGDAAALRATVATELLPHLALLPKRAFNSYTTESKSCANLGRGGAVRSCLWAPCDFSLHLAGITPPAKKFRVLQAALREPFKFAGAEAVPGWHDELARTCTR